MINKVAFFSLFVFLFCLRPASAESYFIAQSGNDGNAGTREQPWRTVQKACDLLRPGDTALVQPGTYYEKIKVNVSGSAAGGFITLQAEGNAVLSGAKSKGDHIISIENKSYVRIAGFEICDNKKVTDGSGIRFEGSGSNMEILNNKIYDIRGKNAMGITVYGTSAAAPVSDLVIDGNEIYDCDPAESEALVLNGNITNFKVTNNYVHDVNNIGIDFIGGEKAICPDPKKVVRSGICRGNRVAKARAAYGGGFAAGIYVDGGRDIVVEGNSVTGCDLGIEVGAENSGITAANITVQDNIMCRNDKAGLVFGGYAKGKGQVTGCRFLGNICYKNGGDRSGIGELWIQLAKSNEVKKNIFYGLAGKILLQAEKGNELNTLDNNVWFSESAAESVKIIWQGEELTGFQTYLAASGQDKNSRFADPQFVSPDTGNFQRRTK